MKNKTKAELISELEEAHQRIAKLEVQQIRQNEIEKKLKENDERYRLLAENAGDYIWVMELATMRISYASPSVERILGYTQEEALKIPLERRYPPRSLKKVGEILEEELKKEEENGQNKIGMRAFLLEAYHKDGHLIWLETTARPIQRNEAGAPTAILGISRDITKRIKTQELLQESNEKLSTTLRSIGDAVIATDTESCVTLMNPIAEKLTGWLLTEAKGKTLKEIFNIVNTHTKKPAVNPVLKVLESGKIVGLANHTMLIAKDGTEYQIADSAAPIRDSKGKTTGVVLVFRDVTEEYQVREVLQKSEEQFRSIFENAVMGFYRTTPDGKILMSNPAIIKMTGYSSFEELAQRSLETTHKLISRKTRAIFKKQIEKNETVIGFESVWTKKDGSPLFVRENAKGFRDAKGNIAYYEGTVEDITEQVQAKSALRKSEERYRHIFNSGAVGIALISADRKFTSANPRFCEMLGYREEELQRKNFAEIIHPDDIEKSTAFVGDLLQNRPPFLKFENRHVKKNGQILYSQVTISTILTESENEIYVLSIIEDITERILAENALRESEDKFSKAFYLSPHSISITSLKTGGLLDVNKGFENTFGYQKEEVIGKTTYELGIWKKPSDRQKMIKIIENDGYIKNYEAVGKKKSGEQFIGDISAEMIEINDEKCLLVIVHDITSQKKYEHEREVLLNDLAHRSMLLQTAANISKSVLAILSPDELLQKTVELIQQYFNYYYVGLFLVNKEKDFLILKAGTGEAGRKMLAVNHKLKINNKSMVGWSTSNAKARIALDLNEEVYHFENPFLPKTRSEMALPLVIHAEAIGALTVQSVDKAAFKDEDIAALQTMADQLAIAIQNAQLFEQAQKDIAERIQAEKALKESERSFRLLFEHSPLGTYIADPQGKILDANQTLLNILGSTSLETTKNINILTFPPLIDIGYSEKFQRCVETGKTSFFEFPYTSKWGKKLLLSSYIVPLINNKGEVEKLYTIMEDITKRKEAEQELHHLRNYLTNIIDSMPSTLIGVDADGKITQWNSEAQRVSGLPSTKVLGQPLEEMLPRLSSQLERIQHAIKTREAQMPPRKTYLKDGETYYEDITIYPLVANGVEGVVIRIDNVTEQVRIEELMIQSEKMLSVGGLAAGMAHEINNPLAGMMQTANVMNNRLSNLEMPANLHAAETVGVSMESIRAFMEARDIPRMLTAINESGQRVAEIIDNMLSFARRSDAAITSVNLTKLLDKTLELAATDYDLKKQYDFKTIKIVKEYADPLPYVPCEEGKIQQVFLNILRNGAQAMHNARESGKEPCFILRTSHEKEADMIRVEIEDNGPGMDEVIRKRVFEPFFTTKPVGDGTGLGLSVSYFIIAENHGGTLDVVSKPNQGAKFIIRLPIKKMKNT